MGLIWGEGRAWGATSSDSAGSAVAGGTGVGVTVTFFCSSVSSAFALA